MQLRSLITLASITFVSLLSQPVLKAETAPKLLIEDDYSTVKHPTRRAARGNWVIADGTATVEQEEALYKKYKNHGPIMIYNVPHTDAHAVVEVKPGDCKTVVFTLDAAEGGHAFRIIFRTTSGPEKGPSSQIVTYAAKEPGAEKAKLIPLNRKDTPKLINNEWNRIEVTVVGEDATVVVGGKTIKVSHPRIAQEKGIAKLGFSFGKLSLRKFTLEAK